MIWSPYQIPQIIDSIRGISRMKFPKEWGLYFRQYPEIARNAIENEISTTPLNAADSHPSDLNEFSQLYDSILPPRLGMQWKNSDYSQERRNELGKRSHGKEKKIVVLTYGICGMFLVLEQWCFRRNLLQFAFKFHSRIWPFGSKVKLLRSRHDFHFILWREAWARNCCDFMSCYSKYLI